MNVIPLLSRLKELEITIQLVDGNLKINAPKGKLPPGLLNQLKEQKQEVIRFLQELQKGNKYSSIEPVEEKEYHVLSSAQKRLFFIQQMIPGTLAYNIPMDIPLYYDIEVERLEFILNRLIVRHESLRTSFHMVGEEPVQRIHDKVKVEVKVKVEEEAPSPAALYERFVQPFDLSQAPLLRVELVKTGEGKSVFLIDMHHIITDGTSQDILSNEFMKLVSVGELEPLRLQYKDFAEWQTGEKRKAAVKKQEEYWLKTFEEEIPILDLLTDYPRPLIQSFAGSNMGFRLEEYQEERLKAMTDEYDVTSYMLLLSIFNVFLSKLSGQEDIVIGTPIAARRHVHLNNIIGMFVNTLPMRNYPKGEKSFTSFLTEVRKNTIEAYENQEYPFEDLVEKAAVDRDVSRNPMFDIIFVLQNFADYQEQKRIRETFAEEAPVLTPAKFDLTLGAVESGSGLVLTFNYSTSLFKQKTIEKFITYFKKIVTQVTNNANIKICDIEIISTQEKERILNDFNNTETEYPEGKTIHELFEDQAKQRPDDIAVVGGGMRFMVSVFQNMHITYEELNRKSSQLAKVLREKGVLADDIVGIMAEPSIDMIVGIFGILKAGGAYLPIDIDYPQDRIDYMLKDSNVKVLLDASAAQVKAEVNEKKESLTLTCQTSSTDLAYIIYTSGTTGRSKGVGVEHRHAVNTLLYRKDAYGMNAEHVSLQLFSFSFDGFVTSFFTPAISGAKVVLPGKEEIKNVMLIRNIIARHGVTHFISIPGFYQAVLESLVSGNLEPLKVVTLAGDKLPFHLLELSREKNKDIEIVHEYGVTEAAVMSTMFRHQERNEQVKIGEPIGNVCIYILDRSGRMQPVGLPGEMCIAGAGVTRGYLNRPELTAERFLSISYRSYRTYSSPKIYKTGDLARWLPDGNIEFLGRIDFQIKIRGFRIELGDIESQLQRHHHVKEAVVIARESESGDKYLCAYIVTGSNTTGIVEGELREYLSRILPDYMIPTAFVQIEKIPLTSNGKIDRKALPKPEAATAAAYQAPGNAVEEKLAALFHDILGLEKVGINDNFFELGGNSLTLIKLVSLIYKEFETEIPIMEVFRNPRINDISKHIINKRFVASEESPVIIFNSSKPKKLFGFPPGSGYGIVYMELSKFLQDYCIYAFNFIEDDNLIDRYVELITRFHPGGPYTFFAFSLGGELAVDVTNRLEQEGYEVSDIILLDSYRTTKYWKQLTLDQFLENVLQHMENMGIGFLKDTAAGKIKKYGQYLKDMSLRVLAPVNASIHLITSSDRKEREKQYLSPKERRKGNTPVFIDWSVLTRSDFMAYNGFGTHDHMLTGEYIGKNAAVINRILTKD